MQTRLFLSVQKKEIEMLEDKKLKMVEKTKQRDISGESELALIRHIRFILRENPARNSFIYCRELEVLETTTLSELLDELEYRFSKGD